MIGPTLKPQDKLDITVERPRSFAGESMGPACVCLDRALVTKGPAVGGSSLLNHTNICETRDSNQRYTTASSVSEARHLEECLRAILSISFQLVRNNPNFGHALAMSGVRLEA